MQNGGDSLVSYLIVFWNELSTSNAESVIKRAADNATMIHSHDNDPVGKCEWSNLCLVSSFDRLHIIWNVIPICC